MLAVRLIMLFDKWWLEKGLDLKIVTYKVVVLDDLVGMSQIMDNTETLKNICEKFGTGLSVFDRNCIIKYIDT